MELWTTRTPEVRTAEHQADRTEQQGWDGITFTARTAAGLLTTEVLPAVRDATTAARGVSP